MEMLMAIANENRNPVSVDKLPKGSKVTHYEVRKENTLSLLGRGNATTARQAVKQLDRILPLGSKAVLSIFANDGDRVVLMRETYVMTRAGVEKA